MVVPAIDRTVVVGPFQCNCRLLVCPHTGHGFLVDPGDEPQKILAEIQNAEKDLGRPIQIQALLHTHAHLDHIGGTRGVKKALLERTTGTSPGHLAEIRLHAADQPLYQALQTQGQMFGLSYEDPLPVDRFLEDGEPLLFGSLRLEVIHTPGHSPGGVSLKLKDDSTLKIPETVFTGDTLFQGSVGRTDLWGADADQMFKSIRTRLLVLDGDTRVCPGHGPESSIAIEKRSNPFLK